MNESDELPNESTLEYIPKSWLMDWFSDPSNVGPVETSMYLCVHANLDVDKLGEVKLCSKQGVNILVAEYGIGEGPRLTAVSLEYKYKVFIFTVLNINAITAVIISDNFL